MNNVSEKIASCLLFFVNKEQPLSRICSTNSFASQSTYPIVTSMTIALTENSTTAKMNNPR
jgi:hypothetical protein